MAAVAIVICVGLNLVLLWRSNVEFDRALQSRSQRDYVLGLAYSLFFFVVAALPVAVAFTILKHVWE